MKKFQLFTAFLFATVSVSSALAGHNGDISCDSSWTICLQSAAIVEGVHAVTSLRTNGQSIDIPQSGSQIYIGNDSSVTVQSQTAGNFVIGTITEAVGADTNSAMSREFAASQGVTLSVASSGGPVKELCNPTAAGILYEHSKYNTIERQLEISLNGQSIAEIQSEGLVQPPISTHVTPFSCK